MKFGTIFVISVIFIIVLGLSNQFASAQTSNIGNVLQDQIKDEIKDKATDALIESTKEVEKITQESICDNNPNSSVCKTIKNYWGLF